MTGASLLLIVPWVAVGLGRGVNTYDDYTVDNMLG
jgi:hypothetical protein